MIYDVQDVVHHDDALSIFKLSPQFHVGYNSSDFSEPSEEVLSASIAFDNLSRLPDWRLRLAKLMVNPFFRINGVLTVYVKLSNYFS